MTFTIQGRYLVGLGNWLNSIGLNGIQSRARSKFLDLVKVVLNEIEIERVKIVNEYAEKDENGDMKTKDVNGQESIVVPDNLLEEFNVKMNALFDKEYELTSNELAPTLSILKNVVINTEEKLKGDIAEHYEKWCQAFEKLPLP